jgi:hypothetical protein
MQIEQAAQAYSNVISRKVITDSWKPELRHDLITHNDKVVEFVPRVVPVDYRPCADIKGTIWEKLDKLTQEWASAIMTNRRDAERSFKMVSNAIYAMTGCELYEAENLTSLIKSCVQYFNENEMAAVRRDWREALMIDRNIDCKTDGNFRGVKR